MLRAPTGVLFLFYSAGNWENASYTVAAARCSGPQGPCRRVYSTAVLKTRSVMAGPGGQTTFIDPTGQRRIAFHAWHSPLVGYGANGQRSMRVLRLYFDGPGANPRISE
jgi:hypothetical protein